jgi:hypothetical protein
LIAGAVALGVAVTGTLSGSQDRALAAGESSAAVVSLTATGGRLDGPSLDAVISANGRFVAFSTDAEFYPGDDNVVDDVFRKDLFTGAIIPISIDDDGVFGDDLSYTPSISADGSVVGFLTDSDELDTYNDSDHDQNGSTDLYIRDVDLGTTRASAIYDMAGDGDTTPYTPEDGVQDGSVSADGNHVVFSTWTTLTAFGDNEYDSDVFVRDLRKAGGILRVSRNPATNSAGGGMQGAISGNGRYAVFASSATDITGGADTNGASDVFIFDRDTDNDGVFDESTATMSTAKVSVDSGGSATNGASTDPTISADGRYVAFATLATDLGAGFPGAYVRDRTAATNSWVSPTFGAPNGTFHNLTISDNGRYVAYDSTASNLVGGDTAGTPDVFRHDRSTVSTVRVSDGIEGASPNSMSFDPSISADGTIVAFSSLASNLAPGDTNGYSDSFVWSPLTDTAAPLVVMLRPGNRYALGSPLTAQWYGFDTSSVASFDVQWKVTRFNQAAPAWAYWVTNTPALSKTWNPATGRTYCWRARGDDTWGNVSAFSTPACTAVPLKATELAYSSGWTRYDMTSVYGGSLYKATSAGRTVKRTNVIGERIAIVASVCPTCGSVKVTFGNYTKTINLAAATAKRKKVIEAFAFTSPRSGTVTIETLNSKAVQIEGLAIYQD